MEELKHEHYFSYRTSARFTFDYSYCDLAISDVLMDKICNDFGITREEFVHGFPEPESDEKSINKMLTISYAADEENYEEYEMYITLTIELSLTSGKIVERHYEFGNIDDESYRLLSSMIDGAERDSVHFMYNVMWDRELDKRGFYDCKEDIERQIDILDELPYAIDALWK